MSKSVKTLFFVSVAILHASGGIAQEGRYHVTFATPDQVLNQIVRTGPAPDYLSSIWFGTPTVVSAFGPLTSQPLLFTSNGQQPTAFGYYYTQVGLSLVGFPTPNLDLSFDFVDVGANHFFTVLFDTPNVRNFRFDHGGIYFDHPAAPAMPIGTYQLGAAYHFNIHLDNELNRWRFSANNNLLAEGAFDPVDYVRSIRFNYSAGDANITGTAIDNVVVVVPEPTSLALCGLALICLLQRRSLQVSPRQRLDQGTVLS